MARILDQYGHPFEQAVLREAQSSRLTHTSREFAQHPAKGLTPPRLAQILESAEMGNLAAQADLFCDMEEKDAHIFAEMSKRKRALLTLDWSVEPPRNASPTEKKQADQVQEWLLDIADFEDVMLDSLDGIGHGFAALEIDWQQQGREWQPKTLTHRPQRWFQTLQHDGNELRLRDGSLEGAGLWPFGWVIHKHKAKSGYLNRAGLHRVLAWPYLFKNYSVRDLAEFLEIYGLPLRLGKYPSGSTDAEKNTLLQAVASIGHNAAGIIPEGMLIEFQEAAKGSEGPFLSMVDWCEKSQSKAILGGTLTSQADGKSSTNALGNVHNEVRHDLKVSDARQLASTLTRDLIYPLLALNLGEVDPRRLPKFKFDTRQPEDLKLYADALPKLVGLGLKVKTEWVHNKLAIPIAKKEDDVLIAPRPEMALPPELRPKPQVADAKFRAVLSNGKGEVVYPDQHALDATELPQLDDAVQILLAPLIRQINAGDGPDEIIAALSNAWPDLDEGELQAMLTRALFVADVWGRINAAA